MLLKRMGLIILVLRVENKKGGFEIKRVGLYLPLPSMEVGRKYRYRKLNITYLKVEFTLLLFQNLCHVIYKMQAKCILGINFLSEMIQEIRNK